MTMLDFVDFKKYQQQKLSEVSADQRLSKDYLRSQLKEFNAEQSFKKIF